MTVQSLSRIVILSIVSFHLLSYSGTASAAGNTVSAGFSHSAVIKSDGSLWTWGYNNDGELGDGTTIQRSLPVSLVTGSWTSIAAGMDGYHTLAIKSDGSLWGWGYNNSGQLGDGTTTQRNAPVSIATGTTWSAISAGGSHTLAIKSDGTLWAWGDNAYGQVGDTSTTPRYQPVPIDVGSWLAVSAGRYHSAAIKSDGKLWVWGYNCNGQLGNGTTSCSAQSTLISIQTGTTWGAVSAGLSHTAAIASDGSLWAWGYNGNGQLGDGTYAQSSQPISIATGSSWLAVAAGGNHTVAIKSDNTLWAWGYNGYGQLGDGTYSSRLAPVQVGTDNHWIAISAGDSHTVAIKDDGSIWTWGYNNSGQLGDGTTSYRNTPYNLTQTVGATPTTRNFGNVKTNTQQSFPIVISNKGSFGLTVTTLTVSGTNASDFSILTDGCSNKTIGGLGFCTVIVGFTPASNGARTAILNIPTNDPAMPVATVPLTGTGTDFLLSVGKTGMGAVSGVGINCGFDCFEGLISGATVTLTAQAAPGYTFTGWSGGGCGGIGQCNITMSTDVTVTAQFTPPTAVVTSSIAAGDAHSLALRSDGSLWAWGYNGYGQLGDGTTTSTSTPKKIGTSTNWAVLAAGRAGDFTVALKTDGSLLAWGNNANGQLGDGTTTNRYTPVRIGTDSNWASVAAGANHTVALKTDGTIWTWGYNYYGQLGDGTTNQRTIPKIVGTAADWVAVSAGESHTIALKSDGTLWAWGYNYYGQLGDGTNTNRPAPVKIGSDTDWAAVVAGGSHTLALKTDGTLWGWGYNSDGELGDNSTTSRNAPVKIGTDTDWATFSAGQYHSIAIKTNGTLWAWGYNYYYQLGDSTTTNRQIPTKIGNYSNWAAIAVGSSHTLALQSDGTLWAWGYNYNGQLGDNTTSSRYAPVALPQNIVTAPSVRNFGSIKTGTSVSYPFFISNSGSFALDLGLIQLGGMDAGEFSVQSDGCSNKVLAPASSCSMIVSFTPTSTGLKTAALSVPSNDPDNPAAGIAFTGTGADRTLTVATTGMGSVIGPNISCGFDCTEGLPDGTLVNLIATPAVGFSFTQWSGACTGTDPNNCSFTIGSDVTVTAQFSASVLVTSVLAAGPYHTLSIKTDGTLWAWGYNYYGQTGDGTSTSPRPFPIKIGTDTDWATISAGLYHSVALKKDGTLWTWGYNSYGELGDGTTSNRYSPMQIGTDSNWSAIAAGSFHTIALKTDGTLWAWGANSDGQLGDGSTIQRNSPVMIGTTADWIAVATVNSDTSDCHTVALRSDGTLWAWGYNDEGELGDNSTITSYIPKQIGTDTDWGQVSAGGVHTLGLKKIGLALSWGYNNNGQLGNGFWSQSLTPTSGPTGTWSLLSAGGSHSAGIQADGSLWTWGYNAYNQLGDGTTTPRNTAAQVGTGPWATVIATGNRTMALKSDGTIWGWGYNSDGQLGDGSTAQRKTPVLIAQNAFLAPSFSNFGNISLASQATHTFYVTNTGSFNLNLGTIGITAGTGDFTVVNDQCSNKILPPLAGCTLQIQFAPLAVGPKSATLNVPSNDPDAPAVNASLIGYGTHYTLTVIKTGMGTVTSNGQEIMCGSHCSEGFVNNAAVTLSATAAPGYTFAGWQDGTCSSSGTGSCTFNVTNNLTVDALFTASSVATAMVAAGSYYSVALKTDGTIWAWGDNGNGQLGDGTTTQRRTPVQVGTDNKWSAIAVGPDGYHTVGLKNNGTLWTWGYNGNGQLGDGTTNQRSVPMQVGKDSDWSAIAAGARYTLAVKTDGTLWAWGYNGYGQLGDGSSSDKYLPEMIGTDSDWVSVAAGDNHSVARKKDGTIMAWGQNWYGQLGNGLTTNQTTPISIATGTAWKTVVGGEYHTMAIRSSDGALWGWGYNQDGELGDGTTTYQYNSPISLSTGTSWSTVAAGSLHSVAVKSDGTLWAWGYNSYNQLGDGTTTARTLPVQIGTASNWAAVAGGYRHTVALKTDGSLWAWGYNGYGQLGDGSTSQRSAPGSLIMISTSPANGAVDVPITSTIISAFSTTMLASTITNTSFTINNGVTGNVSYDSVTNAATFTPSSNLSYGTQYTATLSNVITDVSGTALTGTNTWSFTTEYQIHLSCTPGLSFGSVVAGNTATASCIISNASGTAGIATGSLYLSGSSSFTLANNTCTGQTLSASGGSCTFDITFAPTSSGQLSTWLSGITGRPSVSVTGTGLAPYIGMSPSNISFTATQGDTATQNGSFSITNTGNPGTTLNWTASNSAPWLTITSATTGTNSGTVNFTVNPTGLAGGNYHDYVYINAPNASNSNTYVYVSFAVNGAVLSVDSYGSSGSGMITSNVGGISCGSGGSTCSASYIPNDVVTLTATPDAGSTFTGWSGACSGTESCIVSMATNTSVQATFVSSTTLGGVPQEGNLQITLEDTGRIGITRFINGDWQNQVYSRNSKGSRLQINGTGYSLGYYSGAGVVSLVTNTKTAADTVKGIWTAGGMQIALDLVYHPGDAYYSLKWQLINQSGSAMNDVRFFHGEDTYFFNSDNGAGFWDAPNNTIGVQKTVSGQLMRMSLQSVGAPYAYDSEGYSTVSSYVNAGALTNTLNTNENTDNGYALEWRNPSIVNGDGWTIQAYEKFADVAIGTVAVTAPIVSNCATGGYCDLTFTVNNISGSSSVVTLSSAIDLPTWGTTILSPASTAVAIPAGGSQQVVVRVTVPIDVLAGTVGHVTVSADDGSTVAQDVASVQAAVQQFTLNVSSSGTGTGTVTSSPAGINCGGICSAGFNSGAVVTLNASSLTSTFTGWSGACTGTGPCIVTMSSAQNVIASFDANPIISSSANTGGTISPSGNLSVPYGADQSFSIAAAIGYHIVDVLVDLVSQGTITSYTFMNVTGAHAIGVTFAINTYMLTSSATGTGGTISPTPNAIVNYGSSQTFTISSAAGYHVADVLVDGISVGALSIYTFNNVTASHTIQAVFDVNLAPPSFSNTSPVSNSVINTRSVGYTLSTTVASGKITFTRTGGSADSTPHVYDFVSADKSGSNHTINTGFILVDGAIYSVTFEATDDQNQTTTVTNTNITFYSTPVVITNPSGAWMNASQISLNLKEDIASAQVTIAWVGGTSDSAAPYTFSLAPSDRTNGNHTIDVGAALVNGAIYTITIDNITDQFSNVIQSVSIANVTFDNQSVTITVGAPFAKSIITAPTVSYSLSEDVQSGTITFTRTGGAADAQSHVHSMQGAELVKGTHTVSSFTPPLMDGVIYTVSFIATDLAGNPATTVSIGQVFFDSQYDPTHPWNVDATNESMGNHYVDNADMIKATNAYGSRPGDAKWNPLCDLDHNNVIDAKDLMILESHFGETW